MTQYSWIKKKKNLHKCCVRLTFKVLQRPLVCRLSKIPFILEKAFLIFFVNLKWRGQNFLQRKKEFFPSHSQTNPIYTHKDRVYITGGVWKQLKKK